MRRLHHFALDPFSRKLRVLLREKNLAFDLVDERPGERRDELLHLNPSGEVPVLVEEHGGVVADSQAIAEYLDEVYPEPALLGRDAAARAEVRRLVGWFDLKFDREVTGRLLEEKIMKRLVRSGQPDSQSIRIANANLHIHLQYIAWLADRRSWLAGRPVLPRRHRRRRPSLGGGLSRRHPLGCPSRGEGLVRPGQVAPELPPAAGRPPPWRAAAAALRGSGFLGDFAERDASLFRHGRDFARP